MDEGAWLRDEGNASSMLLDGRERCAAVNFGDKETKRRGFGATVAELLVVLSRILRPGKPPSMDRLRPMGSSRFGDLRI